MPFKDNIDVAEDTWAGPGVDLTSKNFNFQNVMGTNVWVQGNTSAADPANFDGAKVCEPFCGTPTATTLEALFPGQGYTHIFFYSESRDTRVSFTSE